MERYLVLFYSLSWLVFMTPHTLNLLPEVVVQAFFFFFNLKDFPTFDSCPNDTRIPGVSSLTQHTSLNFTELSSSLILSRWILDTVLTNISWPALQSLCFSQGHYLFQVPAWPRDRRMWVSLLILPFLSLLTPSVLFTFSKSQLTRSENEVNTNHLKLALVGLNELSL